MRARESSTVQRKFERGFIGEQAQSFHTSVRYTVTLGENG